MDFFLRMLFCAFMVAASFYGAYANRNGPRKAGLLSFLLNSENFNDWGKLWRIVCLVFFLAMVGVATMKMVAMLLGGPIIDLEQFR